MSATAGKPAIGLGRKGWKPELVVRLFKRTARWLLTDHDC